MINTEKVKLMTELELKQTRFRRANHMAEHYYISDYVTYYMIRSGLAMTIAYAAVLALWGIYNFELLTTGYSVAELLLLGRRLFIIYLLLLAAALLLSLLLHTASFWRAREEFRSYQQTVRKLGKVYQKEEKERSNGEGPVHQTED